MSRASTHRPLVILACLIVLVSLLATTGSAGLKSTVQIGLINLIAVIGIYTFVGNSGIFSFGHISFMAIGAYAFALTTIPPLVKTGLIPDAPNFIADTELGVLPAVVLAGLVAGIFALLLATPLMRLNGLAAGIATLAVLVIVNVVIANSDDITGGRNTLVGVPTNDGLSSTLPYALVALAAAWAFTVSRYGIRLRASREDEHAARAVGISITKERTIAFVISGVIVGVAGAAYANALGSISADTFYLDLTFLTLVMLIVGGMKSLSGAVIGTAVVTAISEILRRIEDGTDILGLTITGRPGLREVGLALLLLLILVLRPNGIMGSKELDFPRRRRSVSGADGSEPVGGPARPKPQALEKAGDPTG